MRLSPTIKSFTINSVCSLYILLFVYAAVSKLLDFENFRVQLGQSPILSSYAGWLSWSVPALEIIISLLLWFQKTRLIGLFLAYGLMVLFTAYIFIILNYSESVPCSCGGILEKLGWSEHLLFNVAFAAIGIIAVLLYSRPNTKALHP